MKSPRIYFIIRAPLMQRKFHSSLEKKNRTIFQKVHDKNCNYCFNPFYYNRYRQKLPKFRIGWRVQVWEQQSACNLLIKKHLPYYSCYYFYIYSNLVNYMSSYSFVNLIWHILSKAGSKWSVSWIWKLRELSFKHETFSVMQVK